MRTRLLTLLFLFCITISSWAYDFIALNSDGVTIYYNITRSNEPFTVAVTNNGNGSYTGAVNIPDKVEHGGVTYSVTELSVRAFSNCTDLSSIIIPESITDIDEWVFVGCSSLTSVVFNAKNCQYLNSMEEAIFKDSPITSFIIGDQVEAIPHALCSGLTQLTSIIIPQSVTSIGKGAFLGCRGLTSIEIPENVANIGTNAFFNCNNLVSIVYNAKHCLYAQDNMGYYANPLFSRCIVSSFIIGDKVESIPSKFCSYLGGFTSIIIPESVTSIGVQAFSYCTSLNNVVFNAKNYQSQGVIFNECPITSFIITDKIEVIPDYLCSGLNKLESIIIPQNVTSIGDYAFSGCSSLKSVSIPKGVTSIGANAFSSCYGITSIHIPNGLETIGNRAFSSLNKLVGITIPESVTSIDRKSVV